MTGGRVIHGVFAFCCLLSCARLTRADSNTELSTVDIVSLTNELLTRPGENLTFVATAPDSDFCIYYFCFENAYTSARCSGSNDSTQATHTFQNAGDFTVQVEVRNNVNRVSSSIDVRVRNPITATLNVTAVQPEVPYLDGILQLNIAVEAGTQPLEAQDVVCSIDYGDLDDEEFTVGNLTEATTLARTYSTLTVIGSGSHLVNVTCWNLINGVFAVTTVQVNRPISDLGISLNDTGSLAYLAGSELGFTVTALYGEGGASYLVGYGDGTSRSVCLERHENFTFSHQYTVSGWFEVSVKAQDDTVILRASLDTFLIIQNEVAGLELSVSPTAVVFPNSTAEYTVTFSEEDVVGGLPDGVTCDWSFGDGLDSRSDYVGNLTGNFTYMVEHLHGPSLANGPNQTATLNCSNLVSYQVLTADVTVYMHITDLEIYPNDTGRFDYSTFSVVGFTVGALNGDIEIKYTINFGDGVIQTICMDRHDNFSIAHNYSVGGSYMVSVTAEDSVVRVDAVLDTPLVILDEVEGLEVQASPTAVIYPDSIVNYILTFAEDDPPGGLPDDVTCEWSFGDGAGSRTDHLGDLTSNFSHMVEYLHPYLPGGPNQSTTVNCSNSVSYQFLTANVSVFGPLMNLTITTTGTGFLKTNETATYIIEALGGDFTIRYTIDFGDGNILTPTAPRHEDFSASHAYMYPGVYWSSVSANDSNSLHADHADQPVIVQHPLLEIDLTADTLGVIPNGETVFYLTSTSPEDPTNVTCTWTHPGGSTEVVDVVFEEGSANYTKLYGREALGDVVVGLNCSNLVSNASASIDLTFCVKLGDLSIHADNYDLGIAQSVDLHINMSSGSNVTYDVDYGNGSSDSFPVDQALALSVPASYPTRGVYNVSVRAYNVKEDVTAYASVLVKVYMEIRDFTLEANSPRPMPPGDVVLVVTPHINYVPLQQVLTWDFADGNVSEEADIVFDQDAPISHSMLHTYFLENYVGNTSVTLNISNPISFQLLDAEFTLIELLADVVVSPDKTFAKTDEEIHISVQLGKGSHVSYTVNYGDGTPDGSSAFDQASVDLLNRNDQFSHAYGAPGVYYVTVTASNTFNEGSHTVPIHVQNTVYDLSLSSNSPVVTPPGNITYTLDTSPDAIPPATNVTCTWVYDDGEDDTTYDESLTLPQTDGPHVYQPSRATIKSELNTVVTCSNDVSTDSASTTVVIVANIVELDKVISNDPVVVEETIDLTLSIINFAHDACFWFDITGPEQRTVLYGRDDCKSIHPVYDEYYAQDETETIVCRGAFSQWGQYHVDVTGENSISSDVVSADFFILPDECKRPTISLGQEGLTPETPREVIYSRPSTIHGAITVDCDLDYVLSKEWKIEKNVSGVFEAIDQKLSSSFDLNIPARRLSAGDYHVTLTGILKLSLVYNGAPLLVDGDGSMYLRVLPTPLKVRISGGDEAVAKASSDLTLTALPTDPDHPENTTSGMTLKWACRVSPEPTLATPPDWASVPEFGFDMGDCFSPGDTWHATFPTLTIPAATLSRQVGASSAKYSFSVQMGKEGRFTDHTQWLTFAPDGDLELDIACHGPNCKSLINHATIFILMGTCQNCLPSDVITFDWLTYKETEIGSDVFEPVDLDTSTFTDMAAFRTKASLTAGQLVPGLHYKMKLSAVTADAQKSGVSVVEFNINKPPYGGTCDVEPQDGGSILQRFRIACLAWTDDTAQGSRRRRRKRATVYSEFVPLDYEVMMSGQLLSFSRESEKDDIVLPVAGASNGTLDMFFIIRDEFGSPAYAEVTVQVETPGNLTEAAIDLMMEVKALAEEGDLQGAMQLITALLALESQGLFPSVIPMSSEDMRALYDDPGSGTATANSTGKPSEFFDKKELPFHSFLIDQIAKLDPAFPREIQSTSVVLQQISADSRYFLEDSSNTLSGIVQTLLNALEQQVQFVDPALVEQISADILYMTGNIANFVANEGKVLYEQSRSRDPLQQCTGSCDQVKDDLKKTMNAASDFFWRISDLLVANKLPGEPFAVQENEKVTMIAGKKRAADMARLTLGGGLGSLSFPEENPYIEDVEPDTCLQILYMAFKDNPYVWDPTASDVNSPVQQAGTKDCDSGQQKQFAEVPPSDPYQVGVSVLPAAPEMTFTVVNDTTTQLVLHFFETRDPSEFVQLFFDPSIKNMTFELYVAYNRTPDNVDFDYNVSLPIYPPLFNVLDTEAVENLTTPFSIILPLNLTGQLGNFTVAAWVKVGGEAVGLTNYTFYIQYVKSRLFESEEDSWEARGSVVELETTATTVRFKSTIFADSLGAGLFIGPNTIDFSNVFNNLGAKILDNMHVLVTIILMVVVFVVLTPFARLMDKADLAMVTPAPVFSPNVNNSNNEMHPYQYTIDVYTGLARGSATDSKVFIKILGTKTDVGVMPLDAPERKNFKSGDMNSFILTSPTPLGKLTYMRLFHDNSGKGNKASWYCEQVVITERHSLKKYLFLVNAWFAVSKGDFRTDRTVPVATREQLLAFKSLFPRRSKKYFTNDHLWISVFYKQSDEKFTRVERLGCAMAAIFMTMIADAMWYQRDESEETKDGFNIGPFAFTLQTLWVSVCSVLTVIPVTFVIIFLFKRSAIKISAAEKKAKELEEQFFAELLAKEDAAKAGATKGKGQELSKADEDFLKKTTKKKKKKSDGRFLPYGFKYVAWVLVVGVIACSSFFTMLYSFEWGGDKSRGWLTAFLLSFTESEFLVSPVKAVVLAVIFSLFCKKVLDDDVEDGEDDYSNAVCLEDDENGPAPLTREQVEEARRKYELEQQLNSALRTLVYHVVFLVVLILITYGNRDSHSFRQNETMRNHFIRNPQFAYINNEGAFYDWMEQIAIPRLFMTEYNNWDPVAMKSRDRKYSEDSLCYRLGPVQLRQYRVKPDLCSSVIKNLDLTCNADYNDVSKDENDYALGWERLTENATSDGLDGAAYVYRHDQDAETSYWGWLTAYSGGGYVANLGTTEEMGFDSLDKLKEYGWFDRYTRALIFEFNAYNAHSNLFSAVSLMFELPSYGAAITREEIKSVKMYRYFGSWGVFALASEIILIIITFFLIIKLIYNVCKLGFRRYFKEFWHRIEMAKVAFTLLAFIFYILRTLFIKNTVEEMMNNRGKVVSFADAVMVDDVFINMIGAALFLQILQLLWVLKFNKSLAELATTIHNSWKSLKSFFVSLGIIFMAFAMVAYHIYGTMLWNYRDFLHTIYSQLTSVLGKFDTNEIVLVGGTFGQIFFMGYQLILLFIFLNMLVAILNDTIADINSGDVEVKYEGEVIDLLIEKLGWGKKKKKAVRFVDEENRG